MLIDAMIAGTASLELLTLLVWLISYACYEWIDPDVFERFQRRRAYDRG